MRKVAGLEHELNIARSTLYRCIATPELRQYVSIQDKLKYISKEGYELLLEKLGKSTHVANRTDNLSEELQKLLRETTMQQQEIEKLRAELQGKKENVNTLNHEIAMLRDLLQREQETASTLSKVILRQEKENALLLEASTKKSWLKRLLKL